MSSKQPANTKTSPALPKSKHGPQLKATPGQGINSRQPRSVRDSSPPKQREEPGAANSKENSVKDGKGGGGGGSSGGETQTSDQNKETGNTAQPETTMAEDPSESKGAKKSPDNGEENHKDSKLKEEKKNDEKQRQKQTKPANTKSNESNHTDKKSKREKSHHKKASTKKTSSKETPATSNNNSKQTRGKTNPKHSPTTTNDKEDDTPKVHIEEQIDDEKTTTEENGQPDDADAAQTDRKESAPRKDQKKKASLDEDSLQMFLSTDDVGDDRQRQWMVPDQYSDETKRKQEEIIRRILEDFDLEETMRKYRNSSVYVYRRDGKSLADFRFRSELIRMMGSEEIRLNDQEWSKKFQDKLREDYDRLLDQQELNLAKAERRRLHRLKMGGIVQEQFKEDGKPEDSFDCDIRLHKTPHALAHGQIEKKSQEGRRKRSTEPVGEADIFANEESCRREREMQSQRHEKIYYPCQDVATQIHHVTQKEQEEEKVNEFGDIASSLSSSIDHHRDFGSDLKDAERRALMERREERQRRICSKLPPNIARLYAVESTSGLYKIAAEILTSQSQ